MVTVGLQPLTSNPREHDTFLVCAEITSGSLERNIVIGLEAENNTAIRKSYIVQYHPAGRSRMNNKVVIEPYIYYKHEV